MTHRMTLFSIKSDKSRDYQRQNRFFAFLRLRTLCVGKSLKSVAATKVQGVGFQNIYQVWWFEVNFRSKPIRSSFERFLTLENSRAGKNFFFPEQRGLSQPCWSHMQRFHSDRKTFSPEPLLGITGNNTPWSYPLEYLTRTLEYPSYPLE